ncbi:immunity 26/phosphotriesterase HocA family protein [Lacinutrix sp. MEBiC02404]
MKKTTKLNGGEIYAIPLFLSGESSIKSFSRDKFEDKGKEFAFCRVIEDKEGGGIFIEVFDLIGNLNQDLESIISSKRLFQPIATSGLAMTKKRWKKIHIQEPYDKEKDSNYSEIKLVLGTNDDLRLFQNGKETPISQIEAKKYEFWKIWMPSQLEKRIIEELFD